MLERYLNAELPEREDYGEEAEIEILLDMLMEATDDAA